jgi:peptidoglycan hydrolase CwlO-like protein
MDLFCRKAKKQIEELTLALEACQKKLSEKQDHINKTNAYWKKKLREVTHNSKNYKRL